MKSLVMALWFLAVTAGNFLTAIINEIIAASDGSLLEGTKYYIFFTGLMLVMAVLFPFVASFYPTKEYESTDAV
jgi:dipeptide/tripeptide permease